MSVTIPDMDSVVAAYIAGLQVELAVSVNGQTILPNVTPGSFFYALAKAHGLVLDGLYTQLSAVDQGLRLATATGQDLEDLVALLGVRRQSAAQALKPFRFYRTTVTSDPVPIVLPVTLAVTAPDGSTQTFTILPNPGQATGVAAVIPGAQADVWALGEAVDAGSAGNIAPGAPVSLQTTVAGINGVDDPGVSPLAAPSVSTVGTAGSTTVTYAVAAEGITGVTALSPVTTFTSSTATLSGTNYNLITITPVPYAARYRVYKNTGTPTVPAWVLLGTIASATVFADQGAAGTPAVPPTMNTANWGMGGADQESDTALRVRAPLAADAIMVGTAGAIQQAVAAIPYVLAAYPVDYNTDTTVSVGTGLVRVVGAVVPLPATTGTAIQAAIDATRALGIPVTWTQLTPIPVALSYTYAAAPSVTTPAALVTPITQALGGYFATLRPGAPVRVAGVVAAIMSVTGVAGTYAIVLTPQGGAAHTNTDVAGTLGQVYGLGAVTSTLGT